MRSRGALAVVLLLLVIVGLQLGTGDPGKAQVVVPLGQLSAVLSVDQVRVAPATPVLLRLELVNGGQVPLTIHLACEPPHDFRLLDDAGRLVWQFQPTCDPGVRRDVTLAVGQALMWHATWPGVDGQGRPVLGGRYFLYGRVMTSPDLVQAGPLPIEVTGPTATPGAVDATATATLPTQVPTATGGPGTVEPTATGGPGTVEPTATVEPTVEPPESGAPFPVAEQPERESRPDVAGSTDRSSCQHLIVWWEDGTRAVRGRFSGPDGMGEPFLIAERGTAGGPARVAYHPLLLQWLVVWPRPPESSVGGLLGRYVLCGGVHGHPFDIAPGTAYAEQPAVAADATGYVVVWRQARVPGPYEVAGTAVGEAASMAPITVIGTGNVAEPALACDGEALCLVAWTEAAGNADHVDVTGRMWAPRQGTLGTRSLAIAATSRNERYPSIAYSGALSLPAYLVSWTDEGAAHTAVKVRGVYPQANGPLDAYQPGPLIGEVGADGMNGHLADVAAQGGEFVVAWASGAASPEDVLATRVRLDVASGQLLAAWPVVISDKHELEGYPAVADAGRPTALVVWQLEAATGSNVWGRYSTVSGLLPMRVVLVGRLTHVGAVVQSGNTFVVRVSRVLVGQFLCSEAVVKVEEPSLAEAGLQPGDEVLVAGYQTPGEGDCVLVVGSSGTYVQRSRAAAVRLPYILRQ